MHVEWICARHCLDPSGRKLGYGTRDFEKLFDVLRRLNPTFRIYIPTKALGLVVEKALRKIEMSQYAF
jgi:hypothetical protein